MASISPRRRRDDFEESRVYEYPQHLREAIEDAPTGAGAYIFHGQEGDLPLYIGKSIDVHRRRKQHERDGRGFTKGSFHVLWVGSHWKLKEMEVNYIRKLNPSQNKIRYVSSKK